MKASTIAVLSGALTFAVAANASPQRVIEITGAPTCGDCRIVVEKSLILRPPPSALRFRIPTKVIRDARGRWFVLDPTGAPFVAVFDSSGKFVGRLAYPAGKRISDGVVLSGNAIRLFGLSTSTFADFGADGQVIRTHQLFELQSAITGAIPLTGNRVVVHAAAASPELFGYPYHVLKPDGTREGSFGAAPNESSVAGSFSGKRTLGAARPQGFWGARVNRYEVSQWSGEGELRTTLTRTVEWFPPWASWESRPDIKRPPPYLISVWQDASNRLWVLSSVPASDWKPYDRASRPVGDAAVRADIHNQARDAMIDVIDLRAGQLLASRRFAEAFMAFAPNGFVFDVEVDGEANDVVVRLWRVAFIQPGVP